MAKVFSDGSGKAAEGAHNQTILNVLDTGPVQLPAGIDPGTLEMARDGQNLVLTAPNGDVIIVENYFSGLDAPALMSSTGALLSPALVQSFLKITGDVQVAAVESSSDGSPVGEVSEVTGHAFVTRADGTKEAITNGTKIYEHDIIETDAKGAVNIKFADESTFAVSQNARMAIDEFSFNAEAQSGSTGISILRGVFMFTSGLIGRENPDAVHLETPVGSIGIRGTIIGGEIAADGKSQISVLEGAIVVRNGAGEQILSSQFETVQLTSFNAPISNIGQLDAKSMTSSYGAVSGVSQQLFTSIQDTAREAQPQGQQQQQEQKSSEPAAQDQKSEAAPTDAGQPAQAAGEAPAQQPAQAAPAQTSAPAADVPVFQTLSTGSGIDNSHTTAQAPAQAPVSTPATTPVTVVSAPAPAPVVVQPTQVAEPVAAPQPVPSSVFTTGGSVAENMSGVTVGQLGLAAAYGSPVTYSLVGNPGGLFSVSSTGVVTLTGTAGDYDAGLNHYDVVVRATRADTGIFTDTQLSVGVTNIDEAPVFTSNTLAMVEGSRITLTAAMIGATDPEGANITYNSTGTTVGIIVNGSAQSSFTHADLLAGRVQLAHTGAEQASATLPLTATDETGHTTTRNFTVAISPVNDEPVDNHSGTARVDVGGTVAISNNVLSYYDAETPANALVFTLRTATNGHVEFNGNGGWQTLAANSTFTQADISAGLVRFVQSGTNATTATIGYTLTDDGRSIDHTLNLSVNTPGQITGFQDIQGLYETTVGTTLGENKFIARLMIADNEITGTPNYLSYSFSVQSDAGGSYAYDSRFMVNRVDGVFKIYAKSGSVFDYEADPAISLKVVMYDGTNTPVTSAPMTLSIKDITESFTLNNGEHFVLGGNTYDAEFIGKSSGSMLIGVLTPNDPGAQDGVPTSRLLANTFTITGVTNASGNTHTLSASDFEIVNRSSVNGGTESILRMKTGHVFPNAGGDTYAITVVMTPTVGPSVTETFTVMGRSDTLMLHNMEASRGFRIVNDINEGAEFGASVTVADAAGSNVPDLVIGVPSSESGAQIGGVYAIEANWANLINLAGSNGTVKLSSFIGAGTGGAFYSGHDYGYGEQLVSLGHFNNSGRMAFATSVYESSSVEVSYHDGTTLRTTKVTGIPTDMGDIQLASIGDVNGDGYSDLLIGASSATNGDGAVGILFGKATPDATTAWSSLTQFPGLNAGGTGFGTTVASIGDINGDGYSDFAVSAPYYSNTGGGVDQGKISIFFGSNSPGSLASADMTIKTALDGNLLGSIMSAAGDFNGDGYDDMMFSRDASNGGQGAVTLMFGAGGGGTLATLVSSMTNLNVLSGFSGINIHYGVNDTNTQIKNFTNVGDFNGDGYDDVGIDVAHDNGDSTYDHTVYIVYGNNGVSRDYDLQALSNNASGAFKIINNGSKAEKLSLTGLGDITGDGYDDLVIGDASANNNNGEVSVVFGSAYSNVNPFGNTTGSAFQNAGGTGKAYVGRASDDTLEAGSYNNLSFHGGYGNDTFVMTKTTNLREFHGDSGAGDTLKLFFSGLETTGASNFINLVGLGRKVEGVERIEFDSSSKQDTLVLNIADIIGMAQSSDDVLGNGFHRLTIALGNSTAGPDANCLQITGADGNAINDLSALTGNHRFTTGGAVTVDGHSFAVYNNAASGVQLLVETHVANATSLATAAM